VGIDWPAGDATILALLAGYVVLALLGVYIVRERLTHRRLRMAVAGPEN
jgi:Tfp pilus assembly protein PilX